MVKGEDKEAWFVLVNAPLHEPGHGHVLEPRAREICPVDYQETTTNWDSGSPNVLMHSRFAPLKIFQNSVAAPGGAIYGRSSNGMRAAFLRTKNKSSVKNRYSVGGSAHPGGGLPLVGISGELVAESIIAGARRRRNPEGPSLERAIGLCTTSKR
jgi:phytoene dehydrogenase-like protein